MSIIAPIILCITESQLVEMLRFISIYLQRKQYTAKLGFNRNKYCYVPRN